MEQTTFANRDDFIVKMQFQIGSIQDYLDQTAQRIDKSPYNKSQNQSQLLAMREKISALEIQLQGVRNADENSWGDVKTSILKSYYELDTDIIRASVHE